MPLDSIAVSALTAELREKLTGARIDKVQQPERDTVLLSLRTNSGNCRLVLCGGAATARAHLTEARYENPDQPPMFCMLLRKHLTGARIAAVEQPERERMILFRLEARDELGIEAEKCIALEMIGRGTNLILTAEEPAEEAAATEAPAEEAVTEEAAAEEVVEAAAVEEAAAGEAGLSRHPFGGAPRSLGCAERGHRGGKVAAGYLQRLVAADLPGVGPPLRRG